MNFILPALLSLSAPAALKMNTLDSSPFPVHKCYSNHDFDVRLPGHVKKYEAFKQWKSNCNWKKQTNRTNMLYEYYPNVNDWIHKRTKTATGLTKNIDIQEQHCFTEMNPGETIQWRITRIGPFTSTGGYDFHRIAFYDLARLSELLAHNTLGFTFVQGYMDSVIDDNGNTLAFPPIHHHHTHIHKDAAKLLSWSESGGYGGGFDSCDSCGWLTVEDHGDTSCQENEGGVACQFHEFPERFGIYVGEKLSYWSDYNDVRMQDSKPLTWYVEIALKLNSDPKLTKIDYLQFTATGFMAPGTNLPSVLPIPNKASSMFWFVVRMPESGEFLDSWPHSHDYAELHKMLVFAGTENDLGLNRLTKTSDPPAKSYVLSDHNHTIDSMEHFLFENYQNARSKQQCTDEEKKGCPTLRCVFGGEYSEVRSLFLKNDIDSTNPEAWYPRRKRGCCMPWRAQKGEYIIIVAFHTPGRTVQSSGYPVIEPQLSATNTQPTPINHIDHGYLTQHIVLRHSFLPDDQSVANRILRNGQSIMGSRARHYVGKQFTTELSTRGGVTVCQDRWQTFRSRKLGNGIVCGQNAVNDLYEGDVVDLSREVKCANGQVKDVKCKREAMWIA